MKFLVCLAVLNTFAPAAAVPASSNVPSYVALVPSSRIAQVQSSAAGQNPPLQPPVSEPGSSVVSSVATSLPVGYSIVTTVFNGRTYAQTFLPTTYSQFKGITAPTIWTTTLPLGASQTLTIASGGVGWMVPTLIPEGDPRIPPPTILPFSLFSSMAMSGQSAFSQLPQSSKSVPPVIPGASQSSAVPPSSVASADSSISSVPPASSIPLESSATSTRNSARVSEPSSVLGVIPASVSSPIGSSAQVPASQPSNPASIPASSSLPKDSKSSIQSVLSPSVPAVSQPVNQQTIITFAYGSSKYTETYSPTTYTQFRTVTGTTSFTTEVARTPIVVTVGPGGVGWSLPTPIPDVPLGSISEPTVLPTIAPVSSLPSVYSSLGQSQVAPSSIPGSVISVGKSSFLGASSAIPAASVSAGISSTAASSAAAASGLTTFAPVAITTQTFSTMPGVTDNTKITTTAPDGHTTVVPVLWHCWFCGGGGIALWGVGPLPGIYPPPIKPPVLPLPGLHWPTITIGPNGAPTPGPSPGPDPNAPKASSIPSLSVTSTQISKSESKSASSASSCSASATAQCSQAVSVITSVSGTITKILTTTTSVCSTVTACSGSTKTATVSSSPDPVHVCEFTPRPMAKLMPRQERTDNETAEIEKRALQEPSAFNNQGAFIGDLLSRARRVPHRANRDGVDDSGRSKWRGVASDLRAVFGNTAGTWAATGLSGCTSVIVISHQGAWLSHLWEKPGFRPSRPGDTLEALVLDPMVNGDGAMDDSAGQQMDGLRHSQGNVVPLASNPVIKIITVGHNGESYYPSQIGSLRVRLGTLYPTVVPTMHLYFPSAGAQEFSNQPEGAVVLQYDPAQSGGNGCVQKARARLWLESNPVPIYDQEWDALPSQRVAQGGQPKRQACSASPSVSSGVTSVASSISSKAPTSAPPSAISSESPKSVTSLLSASRDTLSGLSMAPKVSKDTSVTAAASKSPSSQAPIPTSKTKSEPPPPASSAAPAPPYATGKCRIHITQALGVKLSEKANYLDSEIYDAKNKPIGNNQAGVGWGDAMDTFSKLPFVMTVTPKISDNYRRRHIRDLVGPEQAPHILDKRLGTGTGGEKQQFMNGPVLFNYAGQHWSSDTCKVGGWDSGNIFQQFEQVFRGVAEAIGHTVVLTNREMDCDFDC
ncbi:MAG: hypothetical protein M1814_004434 [Vezdaea aestivalis]|nr:MAG: hypothetical protein M1814_004434 [Vezdaea aestivalis]